MIDLPAASSARAATPPQSANSPQRDDAAQPADTPFRTVLAQEVAQTDPAQAAAGPPASPGTATTPASPSNTPASANTANTPAPAGAAKLKSGSKSAAGDAFSAGNDDASAAQACAAVIAFLPALAALPSPPPATRTGGAAAPAAADGGATTVATSARARASGATFAAAGAKAESTLSAAPADVAAGGTFALSADGASRRKIALDAGLPEPGPATPAPIQSGASTPAPQLAPAPTATIDARVGGPGWDQGLGEKLVWMAGQQHHVAELHLNPPELGPLKITLTLNHDQATAQFVSAHPTVREAIETAMPQLRQMLAGSGISLGNTSVSTGAFGGQPQPQHEPRGYPGAPATTDAGGITRAERLLRRSLGLVDTFA